MGGPSVQERNVPGCAASSGMTRKASVGWRAGSRRGQWRHAGTIMDEECPPQPESLRDAAEQRERIHGHMKEFEQQMRVYVDQHRAEIDELGEPAAGRD